MGRVTRHIEWVLDYVGKGGPDGRPRSAIFLVDDLDRCDSDYVAELLDAIQNLVRDRGPKLVAATTGLPRESGGPYVVVAADGAWLRASYEMVHGSARVAVERPGVPLGYLFLDKVFQLSVRVPHVTSERQRTFLGGLLRDGTEVAVTADQSSPAVRRVTDARSADAVFGALDEARNSSADIQAAVAAAAVDRLASVPVQEATQHWLESYADLLPANPRSMKRFLNTYGLAEAVDALEFNTVGRRFRAVWTILSIRWPALADLFASRSELVACAMGLERVPTDAPSQLAPLLRDPDVIGVLTREPGLDAATVRRLCWGAAARHDGGADAVAVPARRRPKARRRTPKDEARER